MLLRKGGGTSSCQSSSEQPHADSQSFTAIIIRALVARQYNALSYLSFQGYCSTPKNSYMYIRTHIHCTCTCTRLWLPSNQSLYWQTTGYGTSVDDHRVVWWWKGVTDKPYTTLIEVQCSFVYMYTEYYSVHTCKCIQQLYLWFMFGCTLTKHEHQFGLRVMVINHHPVIVQCIHT